MLYKDYKQYADINDVTEDAFYKAVNRWKIVKLCYYWWQIAWYMEKKEAIRWYAEYMQDFLDKIIKD